MGTPLRVLIVEESEDEAQRLVRQLQQTGYDPHFERVESRAALEAALTRPWDLILTDWTLPRFSALEALGLVRQVGLDSPLIIVAAPIGEEAVVTVLQAGAQDFVSRDNLGRLGPTVERALREVSERRLRRRAEEALLRSEERNRRIVETANEGIAVLDGRARIAYANQRLAALLGYSVDEMVGRSIFDFLGTPGERAEAERVWARRQPEGNWRCELRLCRKEGSELWVLLSASSFHRHAEDLGDTLCMVADITDLKRAEAELQDAKALYQCLAEETLAGVYMVRDGSAPYFAYVNRRFAELFGYRPEELIGRSVLNSVAPISREVVEESLQRRLQGQTESFHYELQGVCKDGRSIDVEVLDTCVEYAGERVVLGTLLDITDRKRAEERTRRQQAALLALAKAPAVFEGDLDAAFREIAEISARTLNVSRVGIWLYENERAELRNVELYELQQDRHGSGATLCVQHYPAYFQAVEQGRVLAAERASGDPRTRELDEPYLSRLGIASMMDAPIRVDGQIVGIICHEYVGAAHAFTPEEQSFAASVADMASLALQAAGRKRATLALRESETRLRAILDNMPAIVLLKDLAGRYLLANRTAEEHLHRFQEEMLGETDRDLFPEEVAAFCEAHDRRVIDTGVPLQSEEVLPQEDGPHTYLFTKFLLRDMTGVPYSVATIATDITDRKRDEERLRRSERLLAEAQQVAHIGSWEWDLATNELAWSAEHYRILGLSPTNFEATYDAFLENVHPDDRELLQQRLSEAIEQRGSFSLEFRIVRPDGSARLLHSRGEAFCDEEGNAIRMVGTAQDITEQRRVEEEVSAARLRVLEAEVEKKQFTREILRATTGGKLHLVDAAEVPCPGEPVAEFDLSESQSYARLRERVTTVAACAGMSPDAIDNLVLAAGEAVTNSMTHAHGGRAAVWIDAKRVIVRVSDAGPGIRPEHLSATVFQAGFSTRVSLGMGYTLMLRLADCIWMATGPEGTVLQIANWIHPEQHSTDPLQALLERF